MDRTRRTAIAMLCGLASASGIAAALEALRGPSQWSPSAAKFSV